MGDAAEVNVVGTANPTPLVLLTGVFIAFLSILASNLSQWRSVRVQQTFQALQTLRTDREYLTNAFVMEQTISEFGKELKQSEIDLFHNQQGVFSVDNPSFSQASRFILNQYEFIAAACKQGLLDEVMLAETMRGPFIGVIKTYRPIIEDRRNKVPASLENLVWLYRRFTGDYNLELGPPLPTKGYFSKRFGKLIGVVRQGA